MRVNEGKWHVGERFRRIEATAAVDGERPECE